MVKKVRKNSEFYQNLPSSFFVYASLFIKKERFLQDTTK